MKDVSSKRNNEEYFGISHLKADLKGRSVRGGAVTMAAQISKFILQTGSTVVLARLLVPEDYGLIGMATITANFAGLFKDLGLSAATIQKPEINHKQISTLFWINFLLSFISALIVAALAPTVAWFYKEPRLVWVTVALASSFIFSGLTVQHQALLRRQMHFTALAKIDVFSMSVSVITAILIAWCGLGYWALVSMPIAAAIANAVGVWIACSWRPGLPLRHSGIGSMLAFGGNMTGFSIVNYFSRNLDNILIGYYWGPQQLGLYTQAYKLLLLPITQINTPVTSVAISTLSSLQFEPEKYCKYYYRAILLITSIGMPIVAFMFVSADEIVPLVLGEQWINAVPIFQLLLPAAFIGTFNVAGGWVYQSLGKTNRQLRWGVFASTIDVIGFVISVRWGATGVAVAYSLTLLITLIPRFIYCFEGTPLRFMGLVNTLSKPAIASITAAMAIILIEKWLPNSTNLTANLIISSFLYSLAYFGMWLTFPDGYKTLLSITKSLKSLQKKS